MSAQAAPIPAPTHLVRFNMKTAEGTQLVSHNLLLELYGREMPATVDFFITKTLLVDIIADRIISKSAAMPLCKAFLPQASSVQIELDGGRIGPSRGCVSMAELMSTGRHRGSFKVHLDETIQQPIFGKFVQNSAFDDVFTQHGTNTKDNRFILTIRELINL